MVYNRKLVRGYLLGPATRFITQYIIVSSAKKHFIMYLFTFTFVFLVLPFFCCSSSTEPEDIDYQLDIPAENLVSVVGHFGIGKPRQLILFDFYNTENHLVITEPDFDIRTPRFSHDKQKIIFTDFSSFAFDGGEQFVTLELENFSFQRLVDSSVPSGFDNRFFGIIPLWSSDDSGFYFSHPLILQSSYFSFLTNTWDFFPNPEYGTNVIEVINSDSLLVWGRKVSDLGAGNRYFITDPNGTQYTELINTFLDHNNPDFPNIPEINVVRWGNNKRLFCFVEREPETNRTVLTVSSIDSLYIKRVAKGPFLDIANPVFGPNDEYIIFQEHQSANTESNASIMCLELASGKISTLLNTGSFGAQSFTNPDY